MHSGFKYAVRVQTQFSTRHRYCEVFWAGPHNTISCPAGHHIMAGAPGGGGGGGGGGWVGRPTRSFIPCSTGQRRF